MCKLMKNILCLHGWGLYHSEVNRLHWVPTDGVSFCLHLAKDQRGQISIYITFYIRISEEKIDQ